MFNTYFNISNPNIYFILSLFSPLQNSEYKLRDEQLITIIITTTSFETIIQF